MKGEAEWRGARLGDRPAAILVSPPTPEGGGVAVSGTGDRVEKGCPTTARVSSELDARVSSELETGILLLALSCYK